jgi:hypothetical protein
VGAVCADWPARQCRIVNSLLATTTRTCCGLVVCAANTPSVSSNHAAVLGARTLAVFRTPSEACMANSFLQCCENHTKKTLACHAGTGCGCACIALGEWCAFQSTIRNLSCHISILSFYRSMTRPLHLDGVLDSPAHLHPSPLAKP